MARTKGVSKTPAVQAYLSKNPDATAQQVVDALKAEGLEVSTSLVFNVKAAAKKKGPKKAAKKAAAPASTNGSTTKADQIREVAGGMEKPVRPRDVVAALKDRGVDVLHTQVSKILASMGMKKKKRKAAVPGSAAVSSNGLNINDLVAAKKVVEQVGSVEKVREALVALARLS